MIKVTVDVLAQVILSSLRFAQECFKVKLISKSHNRSLGDTGSRSKSAIHLNIDPRSQLTQCVCICIQIKTKENY